MKSNSGPRGLVRVRRVTPQIEGLDPQQARTRDLFIEKVGATTFEATDLVIQIGSRRSAELGEVLRTCTNKTFETLVKLYMWQPRRPH